jgi:hypothetical protein
MWAKQSTALTLIVGPILDSTGAEYASAVIGDLSHSKNGGTLTALASTATLTYIANGYYTLALNTTNTNTLGVLQITCNKSTYQMPPFERMILPATVYDALTTNETNVSGGLLAATATITATGAYIGNATAALAVDASGRVDVSKIGGTTQTARDIGASVLLSSGTGTGQISLSSGLVTLAGVTHTGAVIPTVTTVTNQLTAAQIATGVWQDTTAGDFTTAGSIGKSLFTSGAVPGAAGGHFIAGTNASLTVTGAVAFGSTWDVAGAVTWDAGWIVSNSAGNAVNFTSLGGNGSGLTIVGDGSGDGLEAFGGATGRGFHIRGGSTSGGGLALTTTSGDGIEVTPTAGNGITVTANGTSKHGMVVTGGTGGTSDGVKAVAGTGGVPIRGDITGNITGNLTGSVGSVSGAVGSVTGAVGSVTGNVTGSVGSVATGGITSTSFAADSITAAALATDAVAEIQSGLSTLTQAQVTGGAYSIQSASCVLGDARIANLDQAVSSRMATYVQPTGFLAATFPTTVASPTNITAGTITTVTNLTNAPTAGDLTATMKTSIGTAVAASAVASVTGNVGGNVTGSVGSVVGNVGGNVVGSVGSVTNRVTANTDQLAGQTVTAATGVTFPTTVSSYAGGAVASVTGSVGSVVGSVGSVTAAVTVTGDAATAAARFLTMIELDGAVYRYTTNALELAPSGGGDGSTLTAIPWNAAWDAEVQSEVADALTAYGVSTYAGADTAGTTTLLNRLTSTRAGYLDNLATAPLTSLGATAPAGWINTAAFAPGATVPRVTLVDTTTTNTDMRGTDGAALAATALSSATWTNTRAGYIDNLSAGAVPTASQIATAWGVRDLGYGVTADEYLQGYLPRVVFAADGLTATVYCGDDTTVLQSLTATRLQTTVGGLRSTDPV